MTKQLAHTILISDIHLGSPLSRINLLRQILKSWTFSKLIIVGDLFASNDFQKLSSDEWQFLKMLSNYVGKGIEIIWIEGNHDIGPVENLRHLLGIQIYQKYCWHWHDKKCLAIHGHQFDKLIGTKFSNFISWIYLKLLQNTFICNNLGQLLAHIGNNWQRITYDVRLGCINLANELDAEFVFAGHTHQSEKIITNDITYINTGCWVEKNCTLVVLCADDPNPVVYEYQLEL